MYNLRGAIEKYLQLDAHMLNVLFRDFAQWKLHTAYSATQKHYGDLDNKIEEKRVYFKEQLKKL